MPTTLADLIFAPTRVLTYQVRVNGVVLVSSNPAVGLDELTGVPAVTSFAYDESSARIDISRCPSWMRAGMPVTIDCGFNGLMMRVWSGHLVALPGEDADYLRDKVLVKGATVQVGTPPDDVPVELNAEATLVGADVQPPLPAGTHIEHEISVPLVHDAERLSQIAVRELGRYGVVPRRPDGSPDGTKLECGGELRKAARAYQLDAIDLSGFTDEDAIELICDRVGITRRNLTEPPEGWYTFDAGAAVRRGRPLDMLAEVMKVGGLEAYHTEDGTVIFRQVEFAPGPSHAWEYDVTDQDLARIISATGELEVTWNPFVRKYSTGLLNIPFLNINSSRVFARNVRHEVGPDGAFTYIDAWGGSRLGGTVEINPIAAFTFKVEREVIGDGTYIVYTCDASASFDPDGSIASYAWSCNRTTTPSVLASTKVMTFRVASSVATPLTLTLTVTDNDGLTHAMSVDLPTAADATEMQIPAIFAALENRLSATPDGGANWNDISGLSGDEVSVDAKPADGVNSGIACYGYTDGSIKRTTNYAVTSTTVLAADAANGTINEVWWDKNLPTRVWACTSTGRLLRSDDDGVTWAVHKDFGNTYPLHRIATPLGGNSVWVFGGRGDVTSSLIQYQFDVGTVAGGTAWTSIAIGGDLATAISGAASSLHVRSASSRMFGELIVIFNGTMPAGSQDNIFYTANVFDPTGAGWTAATGLTAGLTDGREIVPDEAQGTFRAFFGNRSVWNTTDGVAFTETTNVLPAGFTPNRVLWLGDYTGHAGTYLIAAEDAGHTGAIYKWLASEATADELRPATGFATWPASADGRAIAIGAGGKTADKGRVAAITTSASPRTTTKLLDGATWSALTAATGITDSHPRLFCVTPDIWFATNASDDSSDIAGDASRSVDGGLSWAASNLAGGFGFVRAPDGRFWAFSRKTATWTQTDVWYSDDDGANWTKAVTLGNGTSQVRRTIKIAVHPVNANIIAVWGGDGTGSGGFVAASTDRGATWTTTTASVPREGQLGVNFNFHFTILPNGRYVWAGAYSGTLRRVYTSDDNGATWTQRNTETGASISYVGLGFVGGRVVIMRNDATGTPVVTKPLISNNGGVTWALAACDTLQTFTGVTTMQIRAAVYDPATDTFYVSVSTGATATLRVFKLTPINDGGAWTNITLNIGTSSWGTGNLCAIPAA